MSNSIINSSKSLLRYLTTGWRYSLINVGLILLTPLVIGLVVWAEWDLFSEIIWEINVISLAIGFLILVVDMLVGALCWHSIVSKMTGFDQIQQNIKIWLFSNLARRIPTPIWYIASRSIMYKKINVSERATSLASGLEFVLILCAGAILSLVTLPFWPTFVGENYQTNVIWVASGLLIVSLMLMHPRVIQKIVKLTSKEEHVLQIDWGDSIKWVAYYIIVWLIGGAVFFFVIDAFYEASVQLIMPSVSIWAIGSTISMLGSMLVFSGIIREISIVFLLSFLIPIPIAVAVGVTLRLLWLVGELITALISLLL
ncbi:MAG: hypothetical protein AAF902_10585 [Chloroflexota bacterium]